jgi:hypothetical protein
MVVSSTTRREETRHRQSVPSPLPIPDRPFPNPLTICETGPDGWSLPVNPTGTLIWKLVNGRRTADGVVARVRRCFPDTPGSLRDDVAALPGSLTQAGLIGGEITCIDICKPGI